MKITSICNTDFLLVCETMNKLIRLNLNYRRPEIVLEDNSILIFENTSIYYEIVENNEIYDSVNKNINMKYLLNNVSVSDPMGEIVSYKNDDIILINDILINDKHIYHLRRTGLNKVSDKE